MRTCTAICLFAPILLLLSACMKDRPDELPGTLIWNPDLAYPLGTDRFGLNAESGFDTTLFEIDTLTNLPLWVNQVEVVMEGSVPFDINSLGTALENVERLLFRVNFDNEFPHEVLAQAYFTGEEDQTMDSLFRQGPLRVPAGTTNAEGQSTRPGEASRDAVFTMQEIHALDAAYSLRFQARIVNPRVDTLIVDAYRDYSILVDVGIKTLLTFEF